jgi:hypothetical protein
MAIGVTFDCSTGQTQQVEFTPDDGPSAVPREISDRQFFQQLAIAGHITEDEALNAVGPGIIPAAMDALVSQLPDELQFGARMLIRGATIYQRDNPIADLIRQLFGWAEADTDDFWRAASLL